MNTFYEVENRMSDSPGSYFESNLPDHFAFEYNIPAKEEVAKEVAQEVAKEVTESVAESVAKEVAESVAGSVAESMEEDVVESKPVLEEVNPVTEAEPTLLAQVRKMIARFGEFFKPSV